MAAKLLRAPLLASLLALFAALSMAHAAEAPPQRIVFAPGASSASVEGSLSGYEVKDFVFRAQAHQTLSLHLQSENIYTYFRIISINGRPDEKLIPSEEREFSAALPESGNYVVRVFL